jgi:hypothetical protein
MWHNFSVALELLQNIASYWKKETVFVSLRESMVLAVRKKGLRVCKLCDTVTP